MSLRGKNVFITGASSGIGRATALVYAQQGATVFAGARRLPQLETLAAECQALRGTIIPVVIDVTDASQIQATVEQINAATAGYGLDILINNAGYGLLGPIEELAIADLRAQFETNVFGVVAVTQPFLPAMRQRRTGHVIIVGSTAGQITMPHAGAYSATKYALEAIGDALRMELSAWNISVTLIQPGPIDTQFGSTAQAEKAILAATSPYKSNEAAAQMFETLDIGTSAESVAHVISAVVQAKRPPARRKTPRYWGLIIGLADLLPDNIADKTKFGVVRVYPRLASLIARFL